MRGATWRGRNSGPAKLQPDRSHPATARAEPGAARGGAVWRRRDRKRNRERLMEFMNVQYQGINLGACGAFDVEFLRVAGVKWAWLERVIRTGCRTQAAADESNEAKP